MGKIDPAMEALLETFIHETESMLDQLDEIMLESERAKNLSEEAINNIFRITHTIKGSAAMMSFDCISNLAHAVEDVFYVLREAPSKLDIVFDTLFDLVLMTSDFLKIEMEKLQTEADYTEDDPSEMIDQFHVLAKLLKDEDVESSAVAVATESAFVDTKSLVHLRVYFDDDCQMENMRAFMLLNQLQPCCDVLTSHPEDPQNNSDSSAEIIKNGFLIFCKPTHSIDDVLKTIENALNIKSYEILEEAPSPTQEIATGQVNSEENSGIAPPSVSVKSTSTKSGGGAKQSLISVNQGKLDHLMDLVGELVTAESMVIRNPDLNGLKLDNFTKSIRELRKLTDELQDIVMSIRMVPLQGTFHKMDRIVRDMCKRLDKKVEFYTEGGDTEVDKTINDIITDPFMHMIRNSMDHAIESPEERLALGKPETGEFPCLPVT